jgi:anti-sigma regulatory factor (Ser/Thr protein kinase)
MRSGAAAGTVGYFHETALYGSDDELMDVVAPFLLDGVEAGEPTLVTFGERNADLVRKALGPACGVTFLPGADQYARPASAIRSYQRTFARLESLGAEQIRVVGDVPHPGTGGLWDEWVRYEAIVNEAYAPYPVWGLCPYDTRTAPDEVIADVLATHPHIAGADGHVANPRFVDPLAVVQGTLQAPPDPLQAELPAVVLRGASPPDARRAAQAAAIQARLGQGPTEDLLLVVSELVSNAHLHGRPPLVVRMWVAAGRVVLAVSDAGTGVADPFAGLLDPGTDPGGRGLWLTQQVCTDIALTTDADGFTIRACVARHPA